MMLPILAAKLHKPPLPEGVIPRASLMKGGEGADVILVSAQAGSGKSTVVSAWLSEQDRPSCWYSLDSWDNDLMQFLTYLAEGLKAVDEGVSEALKQLLNAFQSIGLEAFLKALVHQLHGIQTPFILVLDDYHAIQNELIHEVLRTLLEHFPPHMQLVVTTREDPPFPLARLRAGRRLLEVRISQLRFTDDEARAYFSGHLPFPLKEAQLQQLVRRTEGWIAGIQMAALSMQGLKDIDVFIEAFTGSQHYVMDYLMEEVLQRHPQEVRDFLLKTSILESFSGELCDSLLQLEAGNCGVVIGRLVRTNSFIVPLDPSGHWYRYHHLFRDLLRQRLAHQSSGLLQPLHDRAGVWFKENGRIQEAIHHLLQADAMAEAAALIERKWDEMDMQLQSASWLDMAKLLPPDILERSPVLAMGYGWALLDKGEIEACRGWFDKALKLYSQCKSGSRPEGVLIGDETQFALLPATIAGAYAYIAAATGDVEGTFTHAHYALEKTPEDQYTKRSVIEMLLGLAHWKNGDLREAEAVILCSLGNSRRTSNPIIEFSFYMVLGELYIQKGDLHKAKTVFEQTISRLGAAGPAAIMLPSLYLGLAKVAFMQGDKGQAYALLEQSKAQGQKYALMDWQYKYYLLLARIYCAEGLFDLARDCISESRAHFHINPIPEDMPIDDVDKQIELAAAHRQLGSSTGMKDEKDPAFIREHANQLLPDPLTARELDVLSLIVSGLSNREICDTLFLALSTVKGYNQNIFEKLGVNRRTQAVLKAKEHSLA
jgi:LuxR family maltose regulon positive regulatory protein